MGLPSDCKQIVKRIVRFQRERFSTFGIRNPVLSGSSECEIDLLFKNLLLKQKEVTHDTLYWTLQLIEPLITVVKAGG